MKSRLTAALIGVALTLAGLLVLEGLSRALLTAQADLTPEQPDWYRYTPDLGWERRPHFKGLVAGEVHRHEPARYLREFDAQGLLRRRYGTDRRYDPQAHPCDRRLQYLRVGCADP
jgi:hypothetical protein